MPESTVILDATAIGRALARIAHEIAERNENSAEVVLVGIPAGGDALADRWRLPAASELLKASSSSISGATGRPLSSPGHGGAVAPDAVN